MLAGEDDCWWPTHFWRGTVAVALLLILLVLAANLAWTITRDVSVLRAMREMGQPSTTGDYRGQGLGDSDPVRPSSRFSQKGAGK